MPGPLLRVGVVGLGMGKEHVKGYRSHPGAEVVAMADTDPGRLNKAGEEFGIAGLYPSLDAMLEAEKLDVVSIATPNSLHRPLAIRALEAGCHVLCEKPMAPNAQDGRAMVEAARRAGRRLMINFSFRFKPQSLALKQLVSEGVLGDVYFARTIWHRRRGIPFLGGWFGRKELAGGGPLIDLGVHRLDLALWLMGYPRPTWVLARTYNHRGSAHAAEIGAAFDVEDLAVGLITFDNGATLEIEASWMVHQAESDRMETRLYGTKGGLVQRNKGENYEFEAEVYRDLGGIPHDLKIDPHPVRNYGDAEPPQPTAMYHFIDAIRHDRPHPAPAEEGLLVTEILDALYRSADEGRPIELTAPSA
ncbi:MAG: Gfo/Idh/MocA family oxidoreductase [Isosphaeraceae bacterium]